MPVTDATSDYVEQTAHLLRLKIPPKYLPGVKKNFAAIAPIAALVMEFKIPHD